MVKEDPLNMVTFLASAAALIIGLLAGAACINTSVVISGTKLPAQLLPVCQSVLVVPNQYPGERPPVTSNMPIEDIVKKVLFCMFAAEEVLPYVSTFCAAPENIKKPAVEVTAPQSNRAPVANDKPPCKLRLIPAAKFPSFTVVRPV